jgi:hypothetical protein
MQTNSRIAEIEHSLTNLYQQLSTTPAPEQLASIQKQIHDHEKELTDILLAQTVPPPPVWDETKLEQCLAHLALPRWFTLLQLAAILPEQIEEERVRELAELQKRSAVEVLSRGVDRFRVVPARREQLLAAWLEPERRDELIGLSERLVAFCADQAARLDLVSESDDWRREQLYHLAAANPKQAMKLMDEDWFPEADRDFELSRASCWLQALEERRDLLTILDPDQAPAWLARLDERRAYLSARTFWADSWYKTINYVERDRLVEVLSDFVAPAATTTALSPWLLMLHGPPGYGKTATVEWLIARFAVPQGHVCARFDYDWLPSRGEEQRYAQRPEFVLGELARSLNAQREQPHKIADLERQDESGDQEADFADLLMEHYNGHIVLLIIDTIEVIKENFSEGRANLRRLLTMLRRIRYGDDTRTTGAAGYPNLRVVLSGRQDLSSRYADLLAECLPTPVPLIELPIAGFTRTEGQRYLVEKRKFTGRLQELVDPILEKTLEPGAGTEPTIVPLKLAMAADWVRDDPEITAEKIRGEDRLDVEYLVKRILRRITTRDLRLLLRYGVLFRHFDAEAAELLEEPIRELRHNQQKLDQEAKDPPEVREALASSRRQDGKMSSIGELFEQLTRYSWVTRSNDRGRDSIRFNPLVWAPQMLITAQQPIFGELQRKAHEHYAEGAATAGELSDRSHYLREALYHGFLMGNRKAAVAFWHEQLERYKAGPGQMLYALVDETFRRDEAAEFLHMRGDKQQARFLATSISAERLLSQRDRAEAHVALAEVLLAEIDRPFLIDQPEQAEQAAQIALEQAPASKGGAIRLRAYQTLARIALERRDIKQALDMARRSLNVAASLGASAIVSAHALMAAAERANSQWPEALKRLGDAYDLAAQAVQERPNNTTARQALYQVRAELIDQLLDSPDWAKAPDLIKAARRDEPTKSSVLGLAARAAQLQGCLADARKLYRRASAYCNAPAERARLDAAERYVRLLCGETVQAAEGDDLRLGVATAVSGGDWPTLVERLQSHKLVSNRSEQIEATNMLIQYYLEIEGNWLQADEQIQQGERIAAQLPLTHPEIARHQVLVQYASFLKSPVPLQPAAARHESARRFHEVETLPTPENRVKAKALLLIVRFFAQVKPGDDERQRKAAQIYHASAAQALDLVFELLLRLPPFDQVDIMRTLAALPGWSSRLLNSLTTDPAEFPAMLILEQSDQPQPSLLAWLADSHDTQIRVCLRELVHQVSNSQADWPLFYSSCARLLAAIGDPAPARQWLTQRLGKRPLRQTIVALDRAWLEPWPVASQDIETLLERQSGNNQTPRAELLHSMTALCLTRSRAASDWDRAAALVDRLRDVLVGQQSMSAWLRDAWVLAAVTFLGRHDLARASEALDTAARLALSLGDALAGQKLNERLHVLVDSQSEHNPIQTWLAHMLADFTSKPTVETPPAIKGFEVSASSPVLGFELTTPEFEVRLSAEMQSGKHEHFFVDYVATERMQGERPARQWVARRDGLLESVRPLITDLTPAIGLTDWSHLLNPRRNDRRDLRKIGEYLRNDLFPPDLNDHIHWQVILYQPQSSLRLFVSGAELDLVPWGLVYLKEYHCWLGQRFCYTYHHPTRYWRPFQGQTLQIVSRAKPSTPEELAYRDQLYDRYDDRVLVDVDSWPGSVVDTKSSKPIKLVHVIGDLHQTRDHEDVVLRIERPTQQPETKLPIPSQQSAGMTADMLAHRLNSMRLADSLLVLEVRGADSQSGDIKLLLLRNRFVAALARLGLTVLALGPRPIAQLGHSPADMLIQQLVQAPELDVATLEKKLHEARQALLAADSDVLRAQLDLYYPLMLET